MATTYILAPPFKWDFLDNLGAKAVDGYIETFEADDHTTHRATFKDPNGTIPWTNRIPLDSYGQVGADDPTSGFPIYWATDKAYYVEVRDKNGALIAQIDNYPYPTATTESVNYNVLNQLVNGQFDFFEATTITPNITTPIKIAEKWFFHKLDLTGTDVINIKPFNPGDMNPEASPKYYVEYLCSVAGTAEETKHFYQKIPGARTFDGLKITVSFAGASATNSIVELRFIQNFGSTSASAQITTAIATYTLTPQFKKYTAEFTVPPTADKTFSPNEDDYVAISLNMPRNTISSVLFTNFAILKGSNPDQEFPYRSYYIEEALVNAMTPAGTIIEGAFLTIPDGYLACDGSAVSRASYDALFRAIAISSAGTTTNASNSITAIADTSLMKVGYPISGAGIPANTTVASIVNGTAITISNNATATGTAVPLVVAPFGIGNGTSTFNVPDRRGRSSVGAGQGVGSAITNRILAQMGGEETHALIDAENGPHTHLAPASGSFIITDGGGNNIGSGSDTRITNGGMATASAGSGSPHNTMHPFLVQNAAIKY